MQAEVPAPPVSAAGDEAVREAFARILARLAREGLADDIATLEPELDRILDPELRGGVAKLVGFWRLRRGDFEQAADVSELAAGLRPDDPDCAYNAAFALFRLGRLEAATARARAGLKRNPASAELCNLLSTCLGTLGRHKEAARFGTLALELKAASARGEPFDLSVVPVPPFDAARPERNVIAFSLFGSDPQYTLPAILNVQAARFVYPGWTCRFYVDRSVPKPVLDRLAEEGAQVKMGEGLPNEVYGTMWRFLVADDPEVDRYLVRDADSVLNVREKAAVEAWIDSGRHFHVMRDHYDHSELVLAGMWGGVRGALPPMLETFRAFLRGRPSVPGRTLDQEFLREALWPTIRQSVLTHDSQFAFGEREDFPAYARLPRGWVGCKAQHLMGRIVGARR